GETMRNVISKCQTLRCFPLPIIDMTNFATEYAPNTRSYTEILSVKSVNVCKSQCVPLSLTLSLYLSLYLSLSLSILGICGMSLCVEFLKIFPFFLFGTVRPTLVFRAPESFESQTCQFSNSNHSNNNLIYIKLTKKHQRK